LPLEAPVVNIIMVDSLAPGGKRAQFFAQFVWGTNFEGTGKRKQEVGNPPD
jgi:hypothetical protein